MRFGATQATARTGAAEGDPAPARAVPPFFVFRFFVSFFVSSCGRQASKRVTLYFFILFFCVSALLCERAAFLLFFYSRDESPRCLDKQSRRDEEMVASVCASAGPADGGARRKKRPVVQEVKKAEGPRSHASVAAGRTVLIRRPRQKARGKRGKTPGLATSQAHLFLSLPKPTGSSRRRRKKGNRDKNQKLGKKEKL